MQDEKVEVKAAEGEKAGIWSKLRFKKKRPTNDHEGASSSPTIKAQHSKAAEEGKQMQTCYALHISSVHRQQLLLDFPMGLDCCIYRKSGSN